MLGWQRWFLKKEFGNGANKSIIATYIFFLFGFGLLSIWYFKSANNLWLWMYGCSDLAAHYGEAISLVDKGMNPAIAIILLVSFAIATIMCLYKRTQIGWLSLIVFPSLFLSFKHGFIRQDGHEAIFFIYFLVVFSLIGLASRSPKVAVACSGSLRFIVFLYLVRWQS